MIQVENQIIALDVFQKQFVCDLNACKGACCVEGDSGAPLLDKEKKIVSTPAYMEANSMKEVAYGIEKLVAEILTMVK